MQAEALYALCLHRAESLRNLRRGHAVLRIARVIHDTVREFEHAARIVAATHGLRERPELGLNALNVGDVIQVDDAAEFGGKGKLTRRGVIRGEHNLLPRKTAGIAHHKLGLRGAVHAAAVLLQNIQQKGIWGRLDREVLAKALVPCKGLAHTGRVLAYASLVIDVKGRRIPGRNFPCLFQCQKCLFFHNLPHDSVCVCVFKCSLQYS